MLVFIRPTGAPLGVGATLGFAPNGSAASLDTAPVNGSVGPADYVLVQSGGALAKVGVAQFASGAAASAQLIAPLTVLTGSAAMPISSLLTGWMLGLPTAPPAGGGWWSDGGVPVFAGALPSYSGAASLRLLANLAGGSAAPVAATIDATLAAWLGALPGNAGVAGAWWNDGGVPVLVAGGAPDPSVFASAAPLALTAEIAAVGVPIPLPTLLAAWLADLPTSPGALAAGAWWNDSGVPTEVL